jgi:2-polyprenyl-6-hydroxyphenyl methylase/3-demethylubiquinone-9 3-methyltransferase
MWSALENVKLLVNKDGLLFIAIYNDQGIVSKVWAAIKKQYCSGGFGKTIVSAMALPYFTLKTIFISIVKQQNPISYTARYKRKRGMSLYHDVKDWLGGFPFEVAKPEAIFEFYKASGFALKKLVTTNRNGCNQFVFQRDSLKR